MDFQSLRFLAIFCGEVFGWVGEIYLLQQLYFESRIFLNRNEHYQQSPQKDASPILVWIGFNAYLLRIYSNTEPLTYAVDNEIVPMTFLWQDITSSVKEIMRNMNFNFGENIEKLLISRTVVNTTCPICRPVFCSRSKSHTVWGWWFSLLALSIRLVVMLGYCRQTSNQRRKSLLSSLNELLQ